MTECGGANGAIRWLCGVFAAVLAGCGGGGDDGTPSGDKAQGAYVGTEGNGVFQALVLEDDEVWAFEGVGFGNAFTVQRFLQGQGLSNNGSFRSASTRRFEPAAFQAVTFNATYTPGTRFEGTLTAGGQASSFSATGFAAATYDYGAAATLAGIANTWTLLDPSGASGSLNIQANGNFTATISVTGGTCEFSGRFTPRASGKNVFNVTTVFAATGCIAVSGKTIAGIAYMQSLSGGGKQLIMAGVTAERDAGAVFFGTR